MKKIIILILILAGYSVSACDFCNCYVGLNPQYKRNFIGVRYHSTAYSGSHHNLAELEEMGISDATFKETRSIFEMHGQFFPAPKVHVLFSVPYMISKETMTGTAEESNVPHTHTGQTGSVSHTHAINSNETIQGFGDPLLIAHYQLFNDIGDDSSSFSQRLLAGGGIKLPLGKWKLEEGAEQEERIHQPGTGSWDYILSVLYLSQYRKFGLNVNANYLIPTANKDQFRFGDKLNANLSVLYRINLKKFSLYPNAGAYYESATQDAYFNRAFENSGGKILYAHSGFDIYFGDFSLNAALQLPVWQDMTGTQPSLDSRFIAGITYSLQ